MSNIKIPSEKNFGIVFTIFFLILSILPILFDKEINYIFLSISLIFLLITIYFSKYLKPANILWFKFGLMLGKYLSPIIIGLIFFLVVTPIGILLKIFNRDILGLKFHNNGSYWTKRNNQATDITKQF